jgi:hypothetical protein
MMKTPGNTTGGGRNRTNVFRWLAPYSILSVGSVVNGALPDDTDRENGYIIYEVEIATVDRKLIEFAIDPGDGTVLGSEEERQDD